MACQAHRGQVVVLIGPDASSTFGRVETHKAVLHLARESAV